MKTTIVVLTLLLSASAPMADPGAAAPDPVIASMVSCPDKARIASYAELKKRKPQAAVSLEDVSFVPNVENLPATYAVFQAAVPDYVTCYSPELKKHPRAQGLIGIQLHVATDGRIERVATCPGAELSKAVVKCVVAVDKKLRFPAQREEINVATALYFGLSRE